MLRPLADVSSGLGDVNILTSYVLRDNARRKAVLKVYSVVDLFAGCGGLSKGFELAGYDIKAAFEFWDVAADCYEANFAHPVFRDDLGDVEKAVGEIQPLSPDVIIGGPPCQDFSHAGKRVEAGRASLTESYAKIVSRVRPHCFVMENVDRAQRSNAYAAARGIFKEAGYGLTEKVLTASYCGVPQRRKRFFCIGILGAEDDAVEAYLLKNLASKEMTVREYLGDTLDTDFYYRHPRNYNRRGVFSIDEPAPTMRGVNRPIPKGYPGHPKDACPVERGGVRPLTTLERSLIQTFPPDYKWTGSKTDCEQMVGNAVPVNLGKYVANALAEFLSEEKMAEDQGDLSDFSAWLEDEKGFKGRSARDVVSRLQRARKMLARSSGETCAVYLAKLGELESFESQSSDVKSQMRRAVKLHAEFEACRKDFI